MRSRKLLLKLFRIGVIGSSVAGAVFLLQQNDWNPSSIGAVRFGRAAYAAVRVAVDYKLTKRMLDPNDPSYQKETSNLHLRSALRLRDMCCANGGAFIKVGQHIGSLEYLLPMEYVNTMKVLLDKAPESKLEDLYRVIEEDLGLKVEDLFSSFEPRPLGAASLAQVHRATLKDGQVVAVKVQHPMVKLHSYVDIKTMEFLVHTMAWFFPDFQYIWLAEETKKNLPKELDFIQEGHNCERVSRMFKKFDFLKIPKIYWNLTSERVLTMEFCEGGRVDNLEYMREHHISVSEVTKNLGKLYSEMIFVQGYVHCDPHPGNVFVNKTPQGTQVILLDHGLYQMLTDDFRMNYSKLWISLINADVDGIKKYAEAMNCGNLHGLFACMLTARSWKAVSAGIDKHEFSEAEGQEIKENAANYFIEITDILNRVPRQMLLILKTNDVLRGIESSLKTRANATSFINMSRCCVRALAQEELKRCRTLYCKLRVWTSQHSQLFKISLYEFYMWCVSTPLVLYFTHRKKQLYS
ncbi:aarF domain-containing protein kinase 1-like isoform X1 [Gigantopelta aegis]|uniref:aarF domain-containing protein kinase 1-like isoform X1 n=1 Tax=Gigantopelta aegis TaxID=1735272 RepID=UPI001B88D5AF|nr:aarF domain-containing protein kinase 1-like isoform X1 [Gigantopelta aegis]XP_041354028.1 aarF domain-containing protein kinase 1-like isoform X1 [Gigantopelta aegis]XP_041354029.1 aarF domain-containing protein kinase 1-like isoform X1 [Gigantopelta aegis]